MSKTPATGHTVGVPTVRKSSMWIQIVTAFATVLYATSGRNSEKAANAARSSVQDVEKGNGSGDEAPWLSPSVTDVIATQWVERVGETYRLDQDKQDRLRADIRRRWNEFLQEHRDELRILASQFLAMRLGPEPPTRERVTTWAEKATPLFEVLREQVDEGIDEFQKGLDAQQHAQLDHDVGRLRRAMALAEEKLLRWRQGEYELEDLWYSPDAARQEPEAGSRVPRNKSAPEAQASDKERSDSSKERDQILVELDAWDRYVRAFIQRYQLDGAQRDAVFSVLSELKIRALAHREHRRADIAQLESRITQFDGTNEKLEALKKELNELYGPVDAMFQELVRRIEHIPTASQRAGIQPPGE